MESMRVDCTTCPGRGIHCNGCMVMALAQLPVIDRSTPPPGLQLVLDAEDRACVDRFVASGLLSPVGAQEVRAESDPDSRWQEQVG